MQDLTLDKVVLVQTFSSNVGVCQGENLSPVLFAIYLNNLVEFISHAYNGLVDMSTASSLLDTDEITVYFRLYSLLHADDTVILAESAAELQASFNAMYLYCKTWKMQVNASKTKVAIFSTSNLNLDYFSFKYNGENLRIFNILVLFSQVKVHKMKPSHILYNK